jgi:hypothetical protein
MKRMQSRALESTVATVVMLLSATTLSAQRFPRPDSSVPPRLTRLPADSIRRHVRQLRLAELLAGIQHGDSTMVNEALQDVEWRGSDASRHGQPRCSSVGGALSVLASRLRRADVNTPSLLLPIFISNETIDDSSGAGVVRATLTIAEPRAAPRTSSISLGYGKGDGRWAWTQGLLTSVGSLNSVTFLL